MYITVSQLLLMSRNKLLCARWLASYRDTIHTIGKAWMNQRVCVCDERDPRTYQRRTDTTHIPSLDLHDTCSDLCVPKMPANFTPTPSNPYLCVITPTCTTRSAAPSLSSSNLALDHNMPSSMYPSVVGYHVVRFLSVPSIHDDAGPLVPPPTLGCLNPMDMGFGTGVLRLFLMWHAALPPP